MGKILRGAGGGAVILVSGENNKKLSVYRYIIQPIYVRDLCYTRVSLVQERPL